MGGKRGRSKACATVGCCLVAEFTPSSRLMTYSKAVASDYGNPPNTQTHPPASPLQPPSPPPKTHPHTPTPRVELLVTEGTPPRHTHPEGGASTHLQPFQGLQGGRQAQAAAAVEGTGRNLLKVLQHTRLGLEQQQQQGQWWQRLFWSSHRIIQSYWSYQPTHT